MASKKVEETKVKVAPKAKAEKAQETEKVAKPAKKDTKNLTVNVLGVDGKAAGTVALPEEIFGVEVNKTLLAQAVRVYLANQRQGNASTKTRGEVDGSTRKIYRQKGTGRARHGSVRAPIFVKGGIVFGPKPRDFSLDLPKKMKRKALFSALAAKLADGQVIVVDGFAKIEPKTKIFVTVLKSVGVADEKRRALLIADAEVENVKRGSRNATGVTYTAASRLNAYDILASKQLVIMKEAIDEMKKVFLKESK